MFKEILDNCRAKIKKIEYFLLRKQFTNSKRQEFLVQIGFLLNAGVPPSSALEHIGEIYGMERNILMKTVALKMLDNIKRGNQIGDNLTDWFPYEICQILSISEERGCLLDGIRNLISYFKSGRSNFQALFGMAPGITYFILVLVFIAVSGTKLLPQIGEVITGEWPTISVALNKVGFFLYYSYPFIILLLIFLIWWIRNSLYYYQDKNTQIVAKPFLRWYKLGTSVLFLKSLSMLTSSGIALSDAILILIKGQTKGFLYFNLIEMIHRIREGKSMGDILNTELFSSKQRAHLKIITQYCAKDEYEKVFQIMGDESSYQLTKSMKIFAKIVNIVFIILTTLGIVWIYGSYALLVSSVT